jgi:hypothetical protein
LTDLAVSDQPFNVPLLPPLHETESLAILKKLTPAARSLIALNQVARLLVDQKLLINLIPILESKSSSEIENIVTTTDELFRYAGDEDNATPAVKETWDPESLVRKYCFCTNACIFLWQMMSTTTNLWENSREQYSRLMRYKQNQTNYHFI